jgi:hypothetical protein
MNNYKKIPFIIVMIDSSHTPFFDRDEFKTAFIINEVYSDARSTTLNRNNVHASTHPHHTHISIKLFYLARYGLSIPPFPSAINHV